ncbi:LuxR C-terminal-related transcriptional regulator [Serratia marcescens]|uniref:response regulator transcription factor n=1 Tax=Serratia marcescens TaxID=615 RepID=UPI0036F7F8C6
MKKNVFIDVFHEDQFYVMGLRFWVGEYCSRFNARAVFNSRQSGEENKFRIIISSSMKNRRYAQVGVRNRSSMVSVFVSPTGGSIQKKHTSCDWLYTGSLSDKSTCAELESLLKKTLSYDKYNLEKRSCPTCAASLLSLREQSVIGYMQQGFSQSHIAQKMNISVKTVHTHKRSVMKKMGLNRNYDFIMWLIQ